MASSTSAHRDTLEFRFLPELRALRIGSPMPAHAARGRLLEILAAFTGSDSPTEIVGLSLFSGCVQLRYDAAHHELFFTGNATAGAYRSTALTLAPGEDLNLHVYVDGSIVEAIANHRAPISVIVTPPAGEEFEAVRAIGEVEASGGLQVWPLRPTVVFDPPPRSNNHDVR